MCNEIEYKFANSDFDDYKTSEWAQIALHGIALLILQLFSIL